MQSVIALVGQPNVGKSTLFNQMTRSRDAIVADQPGLTRDRKYGRANHDGRLFIVVDTGGLSGEKEGLDGLMADQAMAAVEEADIVLFIVDGRHGLSAADENISKQLRRIKKPIFIVANKTEGLECNMATAEFHSLGMGEPMAIAAAHGQGVKQLMDEVVLALPEEEETSEELAQGIKIAMIGRPNVGKSTLVNRILGEERVLAFDMPGTTRDSIYVPFERDGHQYTLIDTAGVRRRKRVSEVAEKFSIIKALQAMEDANVVVVVFDASEGLADQDLHILGYAIDAGRALVLAVNKWDGLTVDQRDKMKADLSRRLVFADFADLHFISALHGTGVGNLFASINTAYESATKNLQTPFLTRILEDAIATHQPPLVNGRRIKLRYAHQGGRNPPIVIIHGNQVESIPEAYRRFLVNTFRKVLNLRGTPVRIEFKQGKNPFDGRPNKLADRLMQKKQRQMKKFKKTRSRAG